MGFGKLLKDFTLQWVKFLMRQCISTCTSILRRTQIEVFQDQLSHNKTVILSIVIYIWQCGSVLGPTWKPYSVIYNAYGIARHNGQCRVGTVGNSGRCHMHLNLHLWTGVSALLCHQKWNWAFHVRLWANKSWITAALTGTPEKPEPPNFQIGKPHLPAVDHHCANEYTVFKTHITAAVGLCHCNV